MPDARPRLGGVNVAYEIVIKHNKEWRFDPEQEVSDRSNYEHSGRPETLEQIAIWSPTRMTGFLLLLSSLSGSM